VWSWLEPLGKVLWELRWPLLLYFGGLLLCYKIIESVRYWIGQMRTARAEARYRRSDLAAVDGMTGQDFRQYLAYLFRCAGFEVQFTPPSGNYGVDLVLVHPVSEERLAVQVRHGDEPVDVDALQEVRVACGLYQCNRAIVVTNASFTDSAQETAGIYSVILVDRSKLQELMACALPHTAEPVAGQG
jgi:restriction system protein